MERDHSRVSPLASPGRRALGVALWVPTAAFVVLLVLGLRPDAAALGWLGTWGAVLTEAAAGLVLVALALAASVPARGVPQGGALALLGVALLVFGARAWLVHVAIPGVSVPNPWLSMGPACFFLTAAIGLTALAIVAALVRRTAPLTASFAGLLGGAGAGILAEGVYQLHCGISDLRHVLVWHGGAIVVLALVGLLLGLAWERREAARLAARLSRR
ncbi:MAG: NrsF family protein [Acidithiobacillales bacterium]